MDERTILLASALKPLEAARVVADAPRPCDLILVSPTAVAHEAASVVAGGRWVPVVELELLAPRVDGESGEDAARRLARALRVVHAHEARAPLVLVDGLDVLGAGVFRLDERELLRLADDLERLVAYA